MANKKVSTLLLIGGALLVYLAAKASTFINGLKITFSNISLTGSLDRPQAVATIKIFNPTNTSINVDGINGILLYQGRKIADIQNVTGVEINPMSNVYLDLMILSDISVVVPLIMQLINKSISNDFTFDGTIIVHGVSIPFKQKLAW